MSSPWLKYAVLAGSFLLAIWIMQWFGFKTSVQLGASVSLVAIAVYFVQGVLRGRRFIAVLGSSFILSAVPVGLLSWMNGQRLAVWAEMTGCLWMIGFALTACATICKRASQAGNS